MRQMHWLSRAVPCILLVSGLAVTACEESSSGGAATTAPSAAPSTATSTTAATSATPAASGSAAAESPEAAAAESKEVADELRDHHRHHHHGGVAMFVAMAIDTLGLPPEKKAQVDRIQSDLHAKMAPARDAEHDLLQIIADGTAAGKIDAAKADAALAKLGTASAGIHTAVADSLTQLHDALSPVERQTLVDKVKAHWEVWQEVNSEDKNQPKDRETHLQRLTQRLSLTPDEVDKMTKALGTPPAPTAQTDTKAVDAHVNAFCAAFVADKFDPKSFDKEATAAAGHTARHGAGRMVKFYEAVVPVLTPDQRTKLADHLKERLADQHGSSAK